MMLKKPMMEVKIPEAMTIRQSGRPKLSTLVAALFRLPRMLKPKMIIDMPRGTKPDSELRRGQYLTKYVLKRLSSETTRKRPITLVTKWETPSKKKN